MNPLELVDVIDGECYFTVKNFALATNRSQQNIRFLMTYGNRIRKLVIIRIAEKPLIPFSELLEFPFTVAGRNTTTVFHYNAEGKINES
jgi:hypothetical protein